MKFIFQTYCQSVLGIIGNKSVYEVPLICIRIYPYNRYQRLGNFEHYILSLEKSQLRREKRPLFESFQRDFSVLPRNCP